MTKIKDVIETAIRGSFKMLDDNNFFSSEIAWQENNLEKMALDPLFWQALGKELGWTQSTIRFEWKCLIDHLFFEKGDIEEYLVKLVDDLT